MSQTHNGGKILPAPALDPVYNQGAAYERTENPYIPQRDRYNQPNSFVAMPELDNTRQALLSELTVMTLARFAALRNGDHAKATAFAEVAAKLNRLALTLHH